MVEGVSGWGWGGGGHKNKNVLAAAFLDLRRCTGVMCGEGGFGVGWVGHNNVLAAAFFPWWRRR